jgi:hypothetical protein
MTAANSPGIVKFLQKLLPIPPGDEKKAYGYLKNSIQHGKFAPFMARAVLAFSYTYYKTEHDSAFSYLNPILEYYPNNMSAIIFGINIHFHQGMLTGNTDWERLALLLSRLDQRLVERNEKLKPYYAQKILFVKGMVAFHRNHDYEATQSLVDFVQKYPKNDFACAALLTLGIIADLEGKRALAIDYYKKASNKRQLVAMSKHIQPLQLQPYQDHQRSIILGNIFDLADRP